MENGLKARKSSDRSIPNLAGENGNVEPEPDPLSPACPEKDYGQEEEFNFTRGTFLIQDLTPVEDEDDLEGLTIGPFVRDSMNNFEEQKESDFKMLKAEPQQALPFESEVLVYATLTEQAAVKKTLEEDELSQNLEELDTDSVDHEKIKELKEKLGKATVPSRNPYISSTTFDVRYQLGQVGRDGNAPETQSIGKKAKKASRWRRFFRGLHRRISFLLPAGLKKETKAKN